jgi:hypothetical protein
MLNEHKKYASCEEAAAALGYTEHYLRKLTRLGKLPALKISGKWRYDMDLINVTQLGLNPVPNSHPAYAAKPEPEVKNDLLSILGL